MSVDKKNIKKFIGITVAVIVVIFIGMSILARKKRASSIYENDKEQKNPFEGKKVVLIKDKNDKENADGVQGHLESIGDSEYKPGFYERRVKRAIDVILSFGGLVILSPIFAFIALAIKIEDPGPVLFTQKRVGQNKQYFKLHKFRSMKMSTPHDVPTHQLNNPEKYITRVGKFLRAHSLDELPQIWDIFIGHMSVVGPRPALWNQDLLIAERDKYGANDVKPGLTGWAQINGRDELEIEDKAKLDGEYVQKIGLKMDIKCFLRSVHVLGKDDSVVEGGTGELHKEFSDKVCRHYRDDLSNEELIGHIGFGEIVQVDTDIHRHVLITGAGSYIGETFRAYAATHYGENFTIDAVDMKNPTWKERDFSKYDIVYHVAGIAHADVGSVSNDAKEKYYTVNTDLAVEAARKAKEEGVKEFIFMSSMIVYGEAAPYGEKKLIDIQTVPTPANFYGDSKLQADVGVRELAGDNFKVIVLRPPMIYGKGSKGNYPTLVKLAKKLPVFPDVDNERSMLYIENFCEFLCQVMLVASFTENSVVLIPQNSEWTRTSGMVEEIAKISGRKIRKLSILNPTVLLGSKIPGKIGKLVNKAFGNMAYNLKISNYEGIDYQKVGLRASIVRTEKNEREVFDSKEMHTQTEKAIQKKKHILIISQYFYPEAFRINDMANEWVKRGYKVTVLTGIPNYPRGKFFDGYGYMKKRRETWNGIDIIRIPLIPRGCSSIGLVLNYASFIISGFFKNLFLDIKADYVFTFEVSPMTQALIGCWYAKKHHVPHYLYVQDLWPENVRIATGITNPIVIGAIDKMVDYIYKNTDEIFATSPSFVDAICNRKVPVSRKKVHYWPQYAEEFYKPMEKAVVSEIPENDSFKIVFTGNIGMAQGLEILPKTAELLKGENVTFIIVGEGRYQPEFEKEIQSRGVQGKFILIPRQPAERIPELLCACDTAFLSFRNTRLFEMTIPAKLQSYMACGMPIIASASGETKRIIEEAKCGICCLTGNADSLAEGITEMMKGRLDLEDMGKNARRYFESHFERTVIMDYFEKYFR